MNKINIHAKSINSIFIGATNPDQVTVNGKPVSVEEHKQEYQSHTSDAPEYFRLYDEECLSLADIASIFEISRNSVARPLFKYGYGYYKKLWLAAKSEIRSLILENNRLRAQIVALGGTVEAKEHDAE